MSITAESAAAAYRAGLTDRVTIRRLTGTGANQSTIVGKNIPARVKGYGADTISGTLQQGEQKIILDAAALHARKWPAPPVAGDKVDALDGRELTVIAVDVNTIKVGSVLIAYVIRAKGK
jgi:hypothetical protein